MKTLARAMLTAVLLSLGGCQQPPSNMMIVAAPPQQSVARLIEAAREGDNTAALRVAQLYYRAGNTTAAFHWTQVAADRGWPQAQAGLGKLYTQGIGVSQNYQLALKYDRLSADQNDAAGLNNLAFMYEHGLGVTADAGQSAQLYRRSAMLGDAFAQGALGRYREQGIGGPKDLRLAYFWDSLAATKLTGAPLLVVAKRRDALAKELAPATIASLQAATSVWKPGTEPPR